MRLLLNLMFIVAVSSFAAPLDIEDTNAPNVGRSKTQTITITIDLPTETITRKPTITSTIESTITSTLASTITSTMIPVSVSQSVLESSITKERTKTIIDSLPSNTSNPDITPVPPGEEFIAMVEVVAELLSDPSLPSTTRVILSTVSGGNATSAELRSALTLALMDEDLSAYQRALIQNVLAAGPTLVPATPVPASSGIPSWVFILIGAGAFCLCALLCVLNNIRKSFKTKPDKNPLRGDVTIIVDDVDTVGSRTRNNSGGYSDESDERYRSFAPTSPLSHHGDRYAGSTRSGRGVGSPQHHYGVGALDSATGSPLSGFSPMTGNHTPEQGVLGPLDSAKLSHGRGESRHFPNLQPLPEEHIPHRHVLNTSIRNPLPPNPASLSFSRSRHSVPQKYVVVFF